MNYPNIYIPKSIGELLELNRRNSKIRILAGGTGILPKYRKNKDFIYLGQIDELKEIRENEKYIYIGSMMTFTDIVDNGFIKGKFNCLWKASKSIGSIQIRNLATIGGNIGIGSPKSDSVSALLALGSEILLLMESGENKWILLEDYLKNKKDYPNIILGIRIPKEFTNWKTSFSKIGSRKYFTISKLNLSCAFLLSEDGNKIKDSRIVIGGVEPSIIFDRDIMNWIKDKSIDNTLQSEFSCRISKSIRENISEKADDKYKERVSMGLVDDIFTELF